MTLPRVFAWLAFTLVCAVAEEQVHLRGSTNATQNNSTLLTKSLPKGAATSAHLAWMPDLSFCLSTDGNRIGNGVKVHLWHCDQKWHSGGQKFFLDEAGRIRMTQSPDYCVVIDGDKYEDGAKIQLWKCHEGNKHQTWYFNDVGQIQSQNAPTRMCLVIDANRAFNGAKIHLWSCQQSSDKVQDWLKISLDSSGLRAYALPNEDKACEFPFEPVATNTAHCVEAAETLRPGKGCMWGGWPDVVSEEFTTPNLGLRGGGDAGSGELR
ncbi:abfB [Symbiodinium natans]|uniref:AbfB protein n=1 Tax=Symbiodinium natans TaxID=878477 RepID=A0A812NZR3_9DINO|nr:abfB [Symbiodinium natans]